MPRSDLALLTLLVDLLLRVGVSLLIIMRPQGTPPVRLAWLLTVLLVPIGGGVSYLLLGGVRMGSRRVRRHREVWDWLKAQEAEDPPISAIPPGAPARLVEALGGEEPAAGNKLELFSDSGAAAESLVADIEGAERCCDLLFYIVVDDSVGTAVGRAMIDAAKRGVRCRLLVDAFGSKRFLKSRLKKDMEAAGVRVLPALPVRILGLAVSRLDHRNHRKIAVIDGRIAWTGSMNLAHEQFVLKPKYAPWVDVMVRVRGPVVFDLHTLFIEDWCVESGEPPEHLRQARPAPIDGGAIVQVLGTSPHRNPLALREVSLFGVPSAAEHMTLTTPYFVPDEVTVTTLITSARAGVPTTLVVPKRNDSPLVAAASRSFYDRLLEAGVHIREFRPGLLHAKTITIGDRRSIISTANLDRRSYELNFEVTLFIADEAFTTELRRIQADYIEQSDPVLLESWRKRHAVRRFAENLVGTMAPLL